MKDNSKQYKLGIIIPNYNRLLEHINNLSEFKDKIKIYYIDDCSDIRYYLNNIVKLNESGIDHYCYRFNKNKGALKARNYMTSKVMDCEYVCYLDSDDEFDANELSGVFNYLKYDAKVISIGSIRNNKLYQATGCVDRMTCTGYTCRFVRTDLAQEAIRMCKSYVKGFGEDIEFTYWIGALSDYWITLNENYAYRVNISQDGLTNSVYHKFDILQESIHELDKAIINKKIPDEIRKCYVLCLSNILNGYIKYSGDKSVRKIEPKEK